MTISLVYVFALSATRCLSAPYDLREVDYNLNTDRDAQNPLQYSGEWEGHNYTASPDNWRFPFYTLFLDRWVNGSPDNDEANSTVFEHDYTSNQLRYGGDLAGLMDSLDYLQGMGIKGIYIAGTPFLNMPWKYDQYSPIDTTVYQINKRGHVFEISANELIHILDHHFGTITQFRMAVEEIHSREMYILLDTTGSTMADLIGFDGYLNSTAPFDPKEHRARWKSNQTYLDFSFDNSYNDLCEYPRFWNEAGERVLKGSSSKFDDLVGCYDGEFDQYGDIEALGYSQTGNDSFRNSHRSKIAFGSGDLRSATRFSTCCAW